MNSFATKTIFIVDDDPFCQSLYTQQLQNLGFPDVSVFSTGNELMKNLYQKPDLIFLDYFLTDHDGLELLTVIKEYDPSIYVVIASGQSDMNVTVQLLNMGAFDYIIKGNNEETKISEIIDKWLLSADQRRMVNSERAIQLKEKFDDFIIEAEEKVREEISCELHDNVSQLLGASKLFIETACTDEHNRLDLLKESRKIIMQAIDEIRKLSHNLQSGLSKKGNLKEDLSRLIDGLKKQKKFDLVARIEYNELLDNVSPDAQKNIFRIIQEQVNNINKYSQAKHVEVNLRIEQNELKLKVSDDGIGFDPAQAKRGLGLNNIADRVSKSQGTYEIRTAPGLGCSWDIHIPVRKTDMDGR